MNPDEQLSALEAAIEEVIRIIVEEEASGNSIPEQLQNELIDAFSQRANELLQARQQTTSTQAPISDSTKLLWILSGGQPQAFVSYLREFPDPDLILLLSNPNRLASIIQDLQKNDPIQHVGVQDGIPQADLQSSNVYGFRFNPRSKKLQVRFQGGSVYEYDGVPDLIFNLFSQGNASARTNGKNQYGQWWKGKNPSLGAALNQYIKAGGYAYRKIKG